MRSEVAACMALCRQALGDETGKLAARGGGAARYTAEERTRFASPRGIDDAICAGSFRHAVADRGIGDTRNVLRDDVHGSCGGRKPRVRR
jgi:hypothetical protein